MNFSAFFSVHQSLNQGFLSQPSWSYPNDFLLAIYSFHHLYSSERLKVELRYQIRYRSSFLFNIPVYLYLYNISTFIFVFVLIILIALAMFSQFENMFKKQAEKITKSVPIDLLGSSTNQDYSKTPQKFNINGRQIEEKKLLAQGAFGFIWIAQDIHTKEQFALKRVICMTEDKIKSALLQKSLMEKLPESPYIVKYYGGTVFKQSQNTVVVTLMQLCSGGNLFDLLQKMDGKGIPQDTVKSIASSVLQGLSVLHKAGFIHRDIKIENILIGKDKRMKICDFGSCTTEIVDFSKIPKADYQNVKQNIEAFTTPMYRPPQIVDPYKKYKVTGKADLWMLGCVLFTMSYFVHPFLDSNAVGISNAVFRFPRYPQETKYKVSLKMQDYIRNFLTPNPDFRPSPQKMLQILSKWDDFTSIPLNQQAKTLKKEQQIKQQQMKKLNQKVTKYDGDIPIQELMKLQKKLQNTNQEHYQKDKTSFITDRETAKISNGSSMIIKKSAPQTNAFSSFEAPKSAIYKKPVPNDQNKSKDIWSDAFSSSKAQTKQTKIGGFDAFNDIFSASSQPKAGSSPNNNFLQFFSDPTGINKQSDIYSSTNTGKGQKKQTEASYNLLDL